MSLNPEYHISDYCRIRKQQIYHKEELLFTGREVNPAAFLTETYKHFNISYPKFYKMDTLCKLGFLASEIILRNFNRKNYRDEDIGIVLYNAASSVDTDRIHQLSINNRQSYFPSPSVFVYTLANIVIGEICIRQKIYGESAFFITEEFNPSALYEYVAVLMDQNIVQACLAGWIEVDGNEYDCVLYRIEKNARRTDGIVNFDTDTINSIYLR